ncbi:hypothetical protein J2S43_001496 [Catenuloplanes nepalensis]|uniref:Uncharacterized protein n=1 Tax=Catenuloplanes nepalensis TaxID=587533 RepID=A0ABT9MNK4_9ACTN|nr:hypothetical protein [Catenuloplanes nepalensis]MDP9792984.1 hypothetical protein [Catenuloplanes nepalensis]
MFVIGTGVIDVLRAVVYDARPRLWHGARITAGFAVEGAVLTAIGRPYHLWRERRGRTESMMHAAQRAAAAARDQHENDAAPVDEEADAGAAAIAAGGGARA